MLRNIIDVDDAHPAPPMRRCVHLLTVALYVLYALLLFSAYAQAQTVNYGGFEDLFEEPVSTSVTGKPQRSSELPATTTIITADEIQASGVRTIPEVLNRIIGMDVLQWGVSSYDVGVRGYNQAYNPRLLVLLNGRQVYLDHFGVTQWSAIPVQMEEIRQIEVVKGPQAALYGFNAVSGVINIITYSPFYDDVGAAQVTVGTQNHVEASAFRSFQIGQSWGVRLSAGAWSIDEFDTPLFPFEAGIAAKSERKTAALDVSYQATANLKVGVDASWSRLQQAEMLANNMYVSSDYEIRSIRGQFEYDTSLGTIHGSVYNNTLDLVVEADIAFQGQSITQPNSTTVANVQGNFSVGNNATVRLSAEYRHNEVDVAPVATATIYYDNYALSATYVRNLSDDLSLTMAGRWDHLELSRSGAAAPPFFPDGTIERGITEYTYNGALVWRPTESDTFRATVGKGVQLPNLNEFGGFYLLTSVAESPLPLVTTGDPFLEPSCAHNIEFAWDHDLPALSGALRVSGFFQESSNLRSIPSAGDSTVFDGLIVTGFRNIGETKSKGLEFELNGSTGKLSWRLGYAYLDIDDALIFGPNHIASVDFEGSQSKHEVTGTLTWRSGGWVADASAKFASGKSPLRVQNAETFIPAPVDVGATLSTRFKLGYKISESVELALSASNAFADDLRMSAGRAVERRVQFTTRWTY